MIVKKVKMSRRVSKRVSISNLVDYLRDPNRGSGHCGERLLYSRGRGFIGGTHEAQRAEMIALAQESVRSKQPVSHYILSWHEGEQPSPEHVERALDIFLEELGLNGHQCIYALHGDTDNVHLHIVVNRVHPERLHVVKPNRGFDIEAAHRAIARIECEQGWKREKHARYTVLENGEIARDHCDGISRKQPSSKARDFEQRTGEKSAERIAQERAAGVIDVVKSWAELHVELAKLGMSYEQKGSGAIIWVGDQPVKASSVSRNASLSALQKRLGTYQPALVLPQQRQQWLEPVKSDMPGWRHYAEERRKHYMYKNVFKNKLDIRQEKERKALQERHKRQRQEILSGSWRGCGEALNALRSVLAAQQAAERAALKQKHKRERERWRKIFPAFSDFEQWLEQHKPDLALLWRYRGPECQSIEGWSSEVKQEMKEALKSKQLKEFEQYAEAVNAERYRVTSIKMLEDGSKQAFVLDKKDGITRGFTPEELKQRIPEMQRLQRRGENLYYTPLSEQKHHILIDDMSWEKLNRLFADGYEPAVVLESSPGNYQAIITVPKLGSPYDRDIGNHLAERLNREYGDPKLSGCIHPHRAPGFENRKPKHRRKDGSYPEVQLLFAKRQECLKTLELAKRMAADYQRAAEARSQQERNKPVKLATAGGSAIEAYQRHYRDVLKRLNGYAVDYSRIDSMIAVRMRVTGWPQRDIETAIRHCAPAIRPKKESRNWDDYTQRTVRYAFSIHGDRKAAMLKKYLHLWLKLERREPEVIYGNKSHRGIS